MTTVAPIVPEGRVAPFTRVTIGGPERPVGPLLLLPLLNRQWRTLVPAFVVSGVGMSLFFAPVANVVLGSVRRDQEGIASGANNAIRELGGVFGIAVLGAVFSARGGYTSGAAFVASYFGGT